MNGAPAKIHSIDGTKVTQVVMMAPSTPAVTGENGAASRKPARKPTKLRHQDQRAGCGLGEAEPSTISGAVIQ
jgi:hypothetical protein